MNEHTTKWLQKIATFSVIGIIFYALTLYGLPDYLKSMFYAILVVSSFMWLVYEWNKNKKISLAKPFMLGAFLMLFDWFVETYGLFLGQWHTAHSLFFVGTAVPVEIMMICLFGAAAWAIHMPKKFSWKYIAGDTVIFAFFGTLGEWLMQLNGLMVYTGGWTSAQAFIGYAITWMIMSLVWYKAIKSR
jgi:hypothetical protein